MQGTDERLSRPIMLIPAIFLLASFTYIDLITDPEFSLRVFYIMPVFLAAWYMGRAMGLVFSGACAACWLYADLSGHTARIYWSPYFNGSLLIVYYSIVAFLLSALRNAYERQKRFATTDQLTGACNRRHLESRLSLELYRAKRNASPLVIAYIDLDNFKLMNDRFGHKVGDELLRSVARIFLDNIRRTDLFSRVGGDEFVLVLPETTLESAEAVVQKLRGLALEYFAQNSFPVSLSIGVAVFNKPPESLEEMLHKADGLMYDVKHQAKNNIKVKAF